MPRVRMAASIATAPLVLLALLAILCSHEKKERCSVEDFGSWLGALVAIRPIAAGYGVDAVFFVAILAFPSTGISCQLV